MKFLFFSSKSHIKCLLYRLSAKIRDQKEDFARCSGSFVANLLHAVNKFTLKPEFKEYYIRAIQNLLRIADNHATSSFQDSDPTKS